MTYQNTDAPWCYTLETSAMTLERTVRTALILALGCLIAGCNRGPQLGKIEGTVRLDGEAVEAASVIFQPDTGAPSMGTTDSEGHFEIMFEEGRPGAVIGQHKVTIQTYRFGLSEDRTPQITPERIPAKYNRQTELVREVIGGRQTFDFDLTSN